MKMKRKQDKENCPSPMGIWNPDFEQVPAQDLIFEGDYLDQSSLRFLKDLDFNFYYKNKFVNYLFLLRKCTEKNKFSANSTDQSQIYFLIPCPLADPKLFWTGPPFWGDWTKNILETVQKTKFRSKKPLRVISKLFGWKKLDWKWIK